MSKSVQVHLHPLKGGVVGSGPREFSRVPTLGETILDGAGTRYVITDVQWQLDGTAIVIAHDHRRADVGRVQ